MNSASSLAVRLNIGGSLRRFGNASDKTINVGFLAPLSGPVSSWGQPGLNGSLIWADRTNASGGILLNGTRHAVKIVPFDCRYERDLAIAGAHKLVLEDDVKLLMMLGGDTFSPIQDFVRERKILTSTLLPSDLSPDTPYLVAPSEIHPIYNVTAVDWLSRHRPEIRTVAMCSQRDALGLPSIATYRAAFEAAGIEIVKEVLYEADGADIREIVAALIGSSADMMCWCTAYEPLVHALTQESFRQNYQGQLLSCTADNYEALIEETSPEFMEGFIFQFPDFDDPKLNTHLTHFSNPHEFYQSYNSRFPGTWSAVSWEYVSILDQWRSAIEHAGTVTPVSVLAAWKDGGRGQHAFGDAVWWGEELFGIDNALVGDWPVVMVRNGKAEIVAFESTIDWCRQHMELLKKHMRDLGQMWDQRIGSKNPGEATPPRRFTPQNWAENRSRLNG